MFTLKLVGKSDNPGNWSAINDAHTHNRWWLLLILERKKEKKRKSLRVIAIFSVYIYIYVYCVYVCISVCTPFLDRLKRSPRLNNDTFITIVTTEAKYICVMHIGTRT